MKRFKILFNLLAAALVFVMSADISTAKTINFAVASDIHYSIQNSNDTERDLSNAPKALKGFVSRVNEKDYDFVIFLGDNIEKSNSANLKAFLKTAKNIKTPYYMVLGNHDVHKISGLEKKEYLEILSQNSKYQKKAQGSYFFCPTSDVIIIVVDNVSSGMPSAHGIFTQKTLKWLDEVLTKNKNKKAVIFQHVPYMTPYLNPSHEILEKPEYRAVINRHDNILAIVSGHYHQEAVKIDDRGIYHISAPALHLEPYYYMDLKIEYDKTPLQKAKNFKLDGTVHPAI